MKRYFWLFSAFIGLASFAPKPGYHIVGHIKGGIEGMKVYLRYADEPRAKPRDSAYLRKGIFHFSGVLGSPRFCDIIFKDTSTKKDRYLEDKIIDLFVENSAITVDAPYDSLHAEFDKYGNGVASDAITVKGSRTNELYLRYQTAAGALRRQHSALFDQYIGYLNPDSGKINAPRTVGMEIVGKIDEVAAKRKELMMQFVRDNGVGPVTAFIAGNGLQMGNINVADVDALMTVFRATPSGDFLVTKFLKDGEEMRSSVVGSTLIDASLQDTSGHTHSLSDYVGKGKYVLVECWASWCHPCRADIPHLKEVYELYHPYGFEVVSVSLDSKKANWVRAIDEERMPWTQLSDLKDFRGTVPTAYHINGIPHCLLFDPQGKLVTVNMRGSWMDNRLIAMYGNHFPSEAATHLMFDIPGLKDTVAYVHYRRDSVTVRDTVAVSAGQFTWTKELYGPQRVAVVMGGTYQRIYVGAGDVRVTSKDTGRTVKVEGSVAQQESDGFEATVKDLDDRLASLYAKWDKGTEAEQASLEKEVTGISKERTARGTEFIAKHSGSFVSLTMVEDRAVMGAYEDVAPVYGLLSEEMKRSTAGKRVAQRLDVLKRSVPGQLAVDFTQNDTTGKPVKFAKFKGKYVLLDFWASWCGPCRAENPNVLKAYNQFKSKNFTVVGVSLDENAAQWKKAIRADKMPWTQLSDLKGGRGNEVVAYYGIMGIPSNLLIDPDGKIIARNLRGAALQAKLAEVL